MENMKPGRELDALIAEKVMRLPAVRVGNKSSGDPLFLNVPPYSTDIAAAWEVLNNYFLVGWRVSIKHLDRPEAIEEEWLADIGPSKAVGISAPHAICLAALKAVEK